MQGCTDVQRKVHEYKEFVSTKLDREIHRLVELKARQQQLVDEYEELELNVKLLQEQQLDSFKSLVDVGAQVYCHAVVPDARRIYVDIGLGFRLECDVASGEAIRAVRLRKQALQAQVAATSEHLCRTRADMRFVERALKELQGI